MKYGRYEIIREVGRGAMGVVYQARDPHIDRIVALKVLRQDRVDNEAFVKRFLKEARVIGRLSHPHIVTIHDVGEDHDSAFIAMEFLEGPSLTEVVQKGRLETKAIIELGVQIAEALDYAHQRGVVHRDVKPSNIIVEAGGQIKITDFGIAHIEDPAATVQTQAGEILGTPAYMSPEQVLGQPVDGRSDLFSLGVILYELVAGQRPFGGEGKSLGNIFNDIVQVTPAETPLTAAAVPRELSALIMKALQKDPAKRFQSGKEFAFALRGIVEDVVQVRRPPVVPVKKHSLLGIWLALAAMGLIIAASLFYYLFSRPPAQPVLPVKMDQPSPALPKPVPKPEAVMEPQPEAKPSTPVPAKQPLKPVVASEPRSAPKSPQPAPKSPQPKPEPATPSEPPLPGSLGGKLKAQEVKPVPGKMIEEKDY